MTKQQIRDSTDVLFRVGRSGIEMMNYEDAAAVIALFPGDAGTHDLDTCSAYVHVGQHTCADLRHVIATTRPATPAEYAALKRELESAPYRYQLRMLKRTSRRHLESRRQQCGL